MSWSERWSGGEEDRTLDLALANPARSSETTFDSLLADLRAEIQNGEWTSPVVVTNSYQAHVLLSGRQRDISEPPSEPFDAGRVLRVYDDRSPYVALLSPAGIPTVRLPPPATRIDGDEADNALAVVIGVSEVPRDEMDNVIAQEQRSRIDEARLRGSLRIRLLEHLEISEEEGLHPVMWRLPDSSW